MPNTYLSRTFASAGNRQSWTWSAWIKKTKVYNSTSSSDRAVWFGGYSGNNDTDWLEFGTQGDVFYFTTNAIGNTGNRLMRDPNAWFHAVVTYDGSNLKFYHNNELDFNNTQLSGNRGINSAGTHTIGCMPKNAGTLRFFDGIMSHVHFVDGSVLAPSVFGQTDATTGEWKINVNPSYTLGTNGFFVLKDTNSGTDQSTNSNNFTAYGTLTKTEDCPSNVFATLNEISKPSSATLSFGNNYAQTSGSSRDTLFSTIGVSSGKYYAEFKLVAGESGSVRMDFGINGDPAEIVRSVVPIGNGATGYSFDTESAVKVTNGSSAGSFGSTFSIGDIGMLAVDFDNLKIYFGKNGTWFNSGDPTSGSTGTGSAFNITAPSSTPSGFYHFGVSDHSTGYNQTFASNFGNGYFGTTAVSSAGTNASGIGIFEYDVPTGYTALSTKGLNE